ncbi:SDR family oxidoreductase [Sphingomonas profundi]|uniref:SDR family oxidoreductase n=1 Tax=Alterirhizorhabdus profundi TaxID=2681549 RepID=UPI0012E7DEDA|nr:SDR family oxidoreductase [Sphingomonas profundi]
MANVVISGASRGIGLELARQYAEVGDRVYAFVRDPANAPKLEAVAAQAGGNLTIHAMDVADDASVKAAAGEIGDVAIDTLINNAGINREHQGLDDMDYDAFREINEVMMIGPFRVFQAFLPNLEKAGTARVMSVTSQLGASTWPYGGYYAYAGAKAGLNRVMRSVAIDVKDRGILVGVVHPGYVKTDMGGPEADIEPSESAAGIIAVTAALTPETTGDFFKWNGEKHDW